MTPSSLRSIFERYFEQFALPTDKRKKPGLFFEQAKIPLVVR